MANAITLADALARIRADERQALILSGEGVLFQYNHRGQLIRLPLFDACKEFAQNGVQIVVVDVTDVRYLKEELSGIPNVKMFGLGAFQHFENGELVTPAFAEMDSRLEDALEELVTEKLGPDQAGTFWSRCSSSVFQAGFPDRDHPAVNLVRDVFDTYAKPRGYQWKEFMLNDQFRVDVRVELEAEVTDMVFAHSGKLAQRDVSYGVGWLGKIQNLLEAGEHNIGVVTRKSDCENTFLRNWGRGLLVVASGEQQVSGDGITCDVLVAWGPHVLERAAALDGYLRKLLF